MGYSFLELAKDVLGQENTPLSVEEMWEAADRMGLHVMPWRPWQ